VTANVLLFLDDLHLGADAEAFAPLALEVARGRLQCVAAATGDEGAALPPFAALARRFEVVPVRPLTPEHTLEVLRGLREGLQEHHRVEIDDEALAVAVELSACGEGGECLPGKVARALDLCAAAARLRSPARPPDVRELDAQVERLNQEKEEAVAEQNFDR